jgi:hypothetical protein
MNLFKSKERKRIESKIKAFTEMIAEVKAEKLKMIRKPDEYAKLWSIEKQYEINIKLLKELL